MPLLPILILQNQLTTMRAVRFLLGSHVDSRHELMRDLDRQIEVTETDLKSHEYRPEDNDPV